MYVLKPTCGIELSFGDQRERDVARLRDDSDPALAQIGEADEVQAAVRVEDARRVRSDQSHVPAPRRLERAPFELASFGAAFAESERQHDHALDAFAPALLDDVRNGRRGGAHQREVDRSRHAREIGIRAQPLDFRRAGIDRIDAPREAILEQRLDRPIPALRRLVRRADHGDCVRREERQEPGRQRYSPRNTGLRFAANASMPSCQSRVIMQASTPSSSVRSAVS